MKSALKRLIGDRRGAIAMSTAVAATVLLMLVGLSAEFARAMEVKQRLQAAADSASLAITQSQWLKSTDVDRRKQVEAMIAANMSGLSSYKIDNIRFREDGDGFARVEIDATVDTIILGLLNKGGFEVEVISQAEYKKAEPIEITFVIDNSPSMLIGSTPEIMRDMEKAFGCAFACHYGNPSKTSYTKSKNRGFELRLDTATNAVITANKMAIDSGYADVADIKFDIFTFAQTLEPIVRDTVGPTIEAEVKKLMPSPEPADKKTKYGMTDPEPVFKDLKERITTKVGATPEKTKHYLIILTDGAANYYRKEIRKNGKVRYRRTVREFRESDCKKLRDMGVQIGVIYTTYHEIPSNSFWRKTVKKWDDKIPVNLKKCADPGWFYEAEFKEDIEAAFAAILAKAIPQPTLTQ